MIFRPNGRLPPTACHTHLESYDTQLSFGLSGNCLSASYEASGFCWQIGLNFLKHLRPCHILSPWIPGPRLLLRYHFISSGWFAGIRFRWIFFSKSSATHFILLYATNLPRINPLPGATKNLTYQTLTQLSVSTWNFQVGCRPTNNKGTKISFTLSTRFWKRESWTDHVCKHLMRWWQWHSHQTLSRSL